MVLESGGGAGDVPGRLLGGLAHLTSSFQETGQGKAQQQLSSRSSLKVCWDVRGSCLQEVGKNVLGGGSWMGWTMEADRKRRTGRRESLQRRPASLFVYLLA